MKIRWYTLLIHGRGFSFVDKRCWKKNASSAFILGQIYIVTFLLMMTPIIHIVDWSIVNLCSQVASLAKASLFSFSFNTDGVSPFKFSNKQNFGQFSWWSMNCRGKEVIGQGDMVEAHQRAVINWSFYSCLRMCTSQLENLYTVTYKDASGRI